MNDKEILAEVYKMCCNPFKRCGYSGNLPMSDVKSFIEQEWQKEDEIEVKLDKVERKERGQKAKDQELVDQYNRNREVKDHIVDVAEINRHRGLVIGEDGAVKELI